MPPIPAIILAAGLSSRMAPRFKPLLPLAGQPLLFHVLQTLTQSPDLSPILLVTGHRAQEVQNIIPRLPPPRAAHVRPIFNPHYESGGMLSSVQCAVRALPNDCPAFLLSLGDQPTILPSTLTHLIQAWRTTPAAPIAIPTHRAKRGHPILLAATCIPHILSLQPHQTLRAVVELHQSQILEVEVPDPGILTDIDTPEDYDRLINSTPAVP